MPPTVRIALTNPTVTGNCLEELNCACRRRDRETTGSALKPSHDDAQDLAGHRGLASRTVASRPSRGDHKVPVSLIEGRIPNGA